MSKYSRLFLAVLSAVVFYGFFGIVISEYLASDAFRSIIPTMRVVALVISLGLIGFSISRFLKAPAD